jgi:predicted ArsR family transcriptional regulator
MQNNNFLLVNLNEEKSKAIAEVIGSKTCRKIINYLAKNKEASQKDLSDALKIPMNTLDYNIKKLLESNFIQKRKNFFWSKKGKKIIMYELSNKSIVISPKKTTISKIKSITPSFILMAAGTFAIWVFEKVFFSNKISPDSYSSYQDALMGSSAEIAKAVPEVTDYLISQPPTPLWIWFLIGALITTIIFSIVNWRKL